MDNAQRYFGRLLALALLAATSAHAGCRTSEIRFLKPPMMWLWGGFGFHNAESVMSQMMTDEFRDERAVKSYREISPSYSRVFAGFADWEKEHMDHFADWYDLTFRPCDTVLYAVPCRMPTIMEDFDCEVYAEQTAERLEYLIKKRNCSRIVHFAVSNELSVGPTYAWFAREDPDGRDRWKIYRDLNRAMFRAFRRHNLEIGIMASDSSGIRRIPDLEWAIDNLGEITECYCWHYYDPVPTLAGDASNYSRWTEIFTNVVRLIERKGQRRRISLGEFGLTGRWGARDREEGCVGVMRDGRGYSARHPDEAHIAALSRAEMGLAALNAGFVNAVSWTFCDYPDPFFGYPGGTTPRDRAEHEAKNRAAFGLDTNYNKWGLFRWDDDGHDYSSYPDLYTMGYLAKLFKRGGRVMPWTTCDDSLRAGAVMYPDGSVSVAVLNWGGEKEIALKIPLQVSKPFRIYEYDSANVPYSAFNDLQPHSGTVAADACDGVSVVRVPVKAKSMTYLTTLYVDRRPPAIDGVCVDGDVLRWEASEDVDHCYYRVYCGGKQIASTVATSLNLRARGFACRRCEGFQVTSVDRWGNEGARDRNEAPGPRQEKGKVDGNM